MIIITSVTIDVKRYLIIIKKSNTRFQNCPDLIDALFSLKPPTLRSSTSALQSRISGATLSHLQRHRCTAEVASGMYRSSIFLFFSPPDTLKSPISRWNWVIICWNRLLSDFWWNYLIELCSDVKESVLIFFWVELCSDSKFLKLSSTFWYFAEKFIRFELDDPLAVLSILLNIL